MIATRRPSPVKLRPSRSIHPEVDPSPDAAVGAAWALSVLSALASAAFAAAAAIGWTMSLWPATPVTLGIASSVVIAGPLTSALLLRAIRAGSPARQAPAAPTRAAAPAVPGIPAYRETPDQVFGHALKDWREQPLPRGRA
jgi:hypothetical protein